jgi:hypothetical protein
MTLEDFLSEEKTIYTITDEHNQRSSITINKWAADLLQETFPDVHAWIQGKYNLVNTKRPDLTRRQKGDIVRRLAEREAERSPNYNLHKYFE